MAVCGLTTKHVLDDRVGEMVACSDDYCLSL